MAVVWPLCWLGFLRNNSFRNGLCRLRVKLAVTYLAARPHRQVKSNSCVFSSIETTPWAVSEEAHAVLK